MKKKLLPIAGLMALTVVLMSATSCVRCHSLSLDSKDDRVTEYRYLKGFEKINVLGSPTVYYTQADSFSVAVTGSEDKIENILTELDGKTLTVRNRGKVGLVNIQLGDPKSVTVHVTSPDLVSVCVSGSGDFISKQRIDTDNMAIDMRGSGDIEMADLLCDRCDITLIGSGDVDMKRVEGREASATLVGSGDINLNFSNVANTQLSLRGSGDIKADFTNKCQKVACELRGSGDITLSGDIEQFSHQKSGSGDIDYHKLNVEK